MTASKGPVARRRRSGSKSALDRAKGGPLSSPSSSAGVELLLQIERAAVRGSRALPIHEQIESTLREMIRSGRLSAGAQLPSTRGFAAQLGVSRGVITEAYGQLAAEGYLKLRQGAAVRVSSAVR